MVDFQTDLRSFLKMTHKKKSMFKSSKKGKISFRISFICPTQKTQIFSVGRFKIDIDPISSAMEGAALTFYSKEKSILRSKLF